MSNARTLLVSLATLLTAVPLLAQQTSTASVVPVPARLKVFDPAYVDKSVSACQDFFAYANGEWVKHDTIPAAFSTSGVSKEMTDANELVVRSVLDDAMASRNTNPANSTVAKLGRYYASCMDSTRADREGVSPVKAYLEAINAVRTRPELLRQIAVLQRNGSSALFNFFPNADPKDAAHYVVWITQGGLGMPDRDYYTKADAASDSLRQKYVAHVARTLALAGEPDASAATDAQRVMSLETELAKASMTRVEQRDPNATYHKTSLADLQSLSGPIS
jgi:putative endopeptidase